MIVIFLLWIFGIYLSVGISIALPAWDDIKRLAGGPLVFAMVVFLWPLQFSVE